MLLGLGGRQVFGPGRFFGLRVGFRHASLNGQPLNCGVNTVRFHFLGLAGGKDLFQFDQGFRNQ
jgi:hypothetical protein